MAGKSELSAAPGVQNVVVYVSNDNFAQAYTVNQQNVTHQATIQNGGYSHAPPPSVVGAPKNYREKPPQAPSAGYFTGVISQNGFQQPIVNNLYQNGLSNERQTAGPVNVRDECDNRDNYVDSGGYVTVMGAEVPQQSVRCDSVRSETAESSCSSLSSTDEGLVVVQNAPPDMVVYDSSASVRPGVVLAATTAAASATQQQNNSLVGTTINASVNQPVTISVPYGWKRLLNNGSIIYISPSNTALNSPEQVKEYLLTAGTCKCGLECHFKYDNVFNFDPKVISKPWILLPDTNTGDLTKLCNHKRKIIAMASLDCKPPDPNIKLRKEYNMKRKKRKIALPYTAAAAVGGQIIQHRDKLNLNQQHAFNKDVMGIPQQLWSQAPVNATQMATNRLQGYPENHQNLVRCQDQSGNRVMAGSQMVVGDGTMMVQSNSSNNISHHQMQQQPNQLPSQLPPPNPSMAIHQQQIIGPNGQIINVQGPPLNSNQVVNQIQNANNGVVIQGQNVVQQQHQHRILINGQPNEPSGPGRPNIQMIPVSIGSQHRPDMQQRIPQPQFFNNQYQQPVYDPSKNVRPFNPAIMNGFRPQGMPNQMIPQHQKIQWPNRIQANNVGQLQHQQQQSHPPPPNVMPNHMQNVYEQRVPPLHQHTPPPTIWQEELKKKKVKLSKAAKNRSYHNMMDSCQPNHAPCPNIDVRQIPNENDRAVIINQLPHSNQSPSFMEDPSGYLAQQTALLNNTINRQTGANGCSAFVCNSPVTSIPQQQNQPQQQNLITVGSQPNNEVPLPSNIMMSQIKQPSNNRSNQNIMKSQQQQQQQQIHQQSNILIPQQYNQMMQQHQQQNMNVADSSALSDQQHNHHQYPGCQGCIADSMQYNAQKIQSHSRPNSEPGTPSSSGTGDDPVTSSTYSEKLQASPDSRPIQGGTVSTSNVSPVDGNHSDPPTPNPHTPTPPQRVQDMIFYQNHPMHQPREASSTNMGYNVSLKQEMCCPHPHGTRLPYTSGIVTTMASGRTSGSNTITSVLAGRANTATVSINNPASIPGSATPNANQSTVQTQAITVNVSKSPLEMVQSVVSSIQVPQTQQAVITSAAQHNNHIIKHSPTGLPPGHILVSSGGQLIMASTGNGQNGVMAPPPPKILNHQSPMPPISVSPMVTNVTGAVTQVIPAVAQQVLGQQTVLVNALPAPFVLQPGVTMTMDGVTVTGQNMQIPQLVTGNVIQQQIQIDNGSGNDPRRGSGSLLSPETKKKGKKRKMSQTVASMLHIAAQQNSGVVMSQQGFPQQIQMAHSPQGITTAPVMQALTIVPSKTGGPPQIVMNGQAMANTQQLINSQPTQQINLLQPVNLINGTTGVVQNFPIQQFIVPNLGGMVMNPDGTATLLQDTSNLGMQLQIQNVNGQNVLTPVQNNGMFNGGQSILAAGPAGMVIRAPTSQGKIIQQQQHSPGAQFLSPNGSQFVVNGTQFGGQLSPLVASVSPSQQVTFGTSPQQIRPNNPQQEFIQCGQTLMVPCTPAPNIAAVSSSNQNTTFVQQNTTIVQQQTTMVSNNQHQLQNFQTSNAHQPNHHYQANLARTTTLNLDHQNFIISSNDNKQMQAVMVQRESPQNSAGYRQSVSTQTAVNQNSQSVTTNTFCQTSTISAGSPPDTTTLSPIASGGQSPPTADTTTHSGSTDDGLSPAPSNCSATCDVSIQGRQQSCSMAMVHCISSSEPDSADLVSQNNSEIDWRRNHHVINSTVKPNYTDITSAQMHFKKSAYAESSTLVSGLQFLNEQMKPQEAVVSSRNYEKIIQKRKNSDTMVVMETKHLHHASLFDDDEELAKTNVEQNFSIGNLVWAPTKGYQAWPGKIVAVHADDEQVSIKWFGHEKYVSKIDAKLLQTLSEGLDAHHQARKKSRTSRKLNTQLEYAIQEAMSELDEKDVSKEKAIGSKPLKPAPVRSNSKKTSGRLRSSTHR